MKGETFRNRGKNYHTTFFQARIELANKRNMAEWQILQTANGWYVVERKPKQKE